MLTVHWLKETGGEVDAHQKLTALMDVINPGRVRYPDQFESCLPLFAAMATPQEISSRKKYKSCSNMSSRVNYNKQYLPLNGKCLDEVMTSSQVAQLLIVAENNITVTEDGRPVWKKEGSARKYTPPQARTNNGGWTQDGLSRYHEFLRREKSDRAKLAVTYRDQKEEHPDYLHYPRRDKQKKQKRKEDVEEQGLRMWL